MKLFRRRPGTVQAVEWDGTNFDEVDQAFGPRTAVNIRPYIGEYVVKDTDGTVRKVPAHEFHTTYEPVL